MRTIAKLENYSVRIINTSLYNVLFKSSKFKTFLEVTTGKFQSIANIPTKVLISWAAVKNPTLKNVLLANMTAVFIEDPKSLLCVYVCV